jgi:Mn2+/Fe2+ NRAMP family transporter
MPRLINIKATGWSLLLWSIIPAAFIGPGTVTTCSKAGAAYGFSLLWALTFSTIATFILQEAAARITIASGKSPGEIIAVKFKGKNASWLKILLFAMVTFGCAAYQAGNILGAVAGLRLLFDVPQGWLVASLAIPVSVLLWSGNVRLLANAMAIIVFFMGIAFAYVASRTAATPEALLAGTFIPALPAGAEYIVVGLIGTTVVPYNLFLAGGLSNGQQVGDMRIGIGLAVFIGGLISMAILLTGTQIEGEFSFLTLAQVLSQGLGTWAETLFALGLFAAGASSAVTAPLAAAISGRSILGAQEEKWAANSWRYRAVWGFVLLSGLVLGLLDLKPVRVILAAQAINGVLLPLVAFFLLLAVNDKSILPPKFVNRPAWNAAMGIVVLTTLGLGLYNIWRALAGG